MKKLLLATAILAAATSANAAIIQFDLLGKAGAGLLSGNENGTIVGTPGSGGEVNVGPNGGIFYDDVLNKLTINVAWGSGNGFTDLSTTASAGHIHGATASGGTASFLQNVGVLIGFGGASGYTFNASATNGSVVGTNTAAISEAQEADLLAGKWYVNIHTAPINAGGEIRGNLVQVVPEPATAGLAALGAIGLMARRRSKRA